MADNNQPYDPANDALQKAVKAGDDGPTSAMSRALQKAYQSPPALVAQGLAHLNDPNSGLDYETKMAAVQPLLEAKHFGGPNPSGQGSIMTAKEAKSGIQTIGQDAATAGGIYQAGKYAAGKLGILNGAASTWAGADIGASGIGEAAMFA